MSQVQQIRMQVIEGASAAALQTAYDTFREGRAEAVWITVIRVADFAIAVFYME